jgi:hypothetical protein
MGRKPKKATPRARAPGKAKAATASMLSIPTALAVIAAIGAVVVGLRRLNGHSYTSGQVDATPAPVGRERSWGRTTKKAVLARRAAAKCNDVAKEAQCVPWATGGECAESPGWMVVHCAASCDACDLLDPAVRCSREALKTLESGPAFKVGELDAMFEGLKTRFPEYDVQELSRPPAGPWIVKFRNFVQDDEIDALLSLAGDFKRSTDQGAALDDNVVEQVVSTSRTSENAWCDSACESDARVRRVTKRISKVTGVERGNFEVRARARARVVGAA